DVNAADEAYMESLGFEELSNGMRLRRDARVVRRDLMGLEMAQSSADAALAGALRELGFTLPPAVRAVDLGVLLLLGLVACCAVRAVRRDAEPWASLAEAAPSEPDELDEGQRKALEGADTQAIPTLDGMRGIAVLLVLMFHFAWTFPGDDPSQAVGLTDR